MAGDASRTLRRRLIDGREPIVRHQSRILKALRGCLYVLVALVALFCAWTVAGGWPLISIGWGWGQDNCSFGSVSNARYREILDEAKRREAGAWRVHDKPPAGVTGWQWARSGAIEARFDDLTVGMTSVTERIAAMHAIMRARGAIYRGVSVWFPDPPAETFGDARSDASTRPPFVNFRYNRWDPKYLPGGCLIDCWELYSINFYKTGRELRNFPRQTTNQFTARLLPPSYKAAGSGLNMYRFRVTPCPPVPAQAWEAEYLNSLKK